jgi:serine/threonine-protein kinase SRPK3
MKLIRKLGSGAFADVYLAQLPCGLVAVKTTKPDLVADKDLIKCTIREIEILSKFCDSKYISNIIAYGKKTNAIVLELLGDKLSDLLEHYNKINRLIPLPIVKRFTKQILAGLIEMKAADVMHNDLKPENIMLSRRLPKMFKCSVKRMILNQLSLRPASKEDDLIAHLKRFNEVLKELMLVGMHVKITDFGNAYTRKHACDDASFRYVVPTRYYISPEILIKSPYWVESDMWCFGCIVYELLSGELLFDPKRVNNMGINTAHIGLIIQMFGHFPQSMLDAGRKTNRYFVDKKLYRFDYLIKRVRPFNDMIVDVGHENHNEIRDFLSLIFEIDPKKRITPEMLIDHKFIQTDWLS